MDIKVERNVRGLVGMGSVNPLWEQVLLALMRWRTERVVYACQSGNQNYSDRLPNIFSQTNEILLMAKLSQPHSNRITEKYCITQQFCKIK